MASVFDDSARPPSPAQLRRALGPAKTQWSSLIAAVGKRTAVVQDWHFAGAKYGWSMRLKSGERTLIYMTPQAGSFVFGVALGEKAVNAARASGKISETALAIIDAAPKYAEGRGIRFTVATGEDVGVARDLALVKLGS